MSLCVLADRTGRWPKFSCLPWDTEPCHGLLPHRGPPIIVMICGISACLYGQDSAMLRHSPCLLGSYFSVGAVRKLHFHYHPWSSPTQWGRYRSSHFRKGEIKHTNSSLLFQECSNNERPNCARTGSVEPQKLYFNLLQQEIPIHNSECDLVSGLRSTKIHLTLTRNRLYALSHWTLFVQSSLR